MKILKKAGSLIKISDLFYSSQMLRYERENEYRTYTGGIISIILLVTVIAGFANMIIETLNLSSISSTLTIEKLSDPSSLNLEISSNSKFMFGLEIAGTNLSQGMRYFDVITYLVTAHGLSYEMNPIPMGPCTKEHWKFLPEMVEKFDVLGASNWLCPDLGQVLEIAGKYSSSTYKFIYSTVNKCNSSLDLSRPCANDTEISNFLFNEGFATGNGYYTVFFSNPIINPSQEEYINYFLEDKNYMIFNTDAGGEATIYFSDYTIESDKSIWPFENNEQDSGFIAYEKGDSYSFNPKGDLLLSISFAKSTSSLTYDREVQKISSVFSFIGGLIGAFSAALFVIKLYTDTSFQITIGLNLFSSKPDKDDNSETNQAIDTKDDVSLPQSFNLFLYIKMKFYEICKKFQKTTKWKQIDYINECHQQVIKQLDVERLIKRIIFIESCLTYMLEDYQLEAMQIPQYLTPAKVRQQRIKFNCINDDSDESEIKPLSDDSVKSNSENCGQLISVIQPSSNLQSKHSKIMTDILNEGATNSPTTFKFHGITQFKDIQDDPVEDLKDNQAFEFIKTKLKGKHRNSFSLLQKGVNEGDQISRKIISKINLQIKEERRKTKRVSIQLKEKQVCKIQQMS